VPGLRLFRDEVPDVAEEPANRRTQAMDDP
jgi:hypothetical protein